MERVVGTLVRPFFNDQEQSDIENSELDLKTGLNQRLDKITFLNEKISEYLLITSRGDLNSDQSREVFSLLSTVNYLQSMNNIVNLRFERLLDNKKNADGNFSQEGQDEISDYHTKLVKQVKRLNKFFTKFDRTKAEKIMTKGQQYKDIEEKYRLEHFQRVSGDIAESVATHQLHMDIMDMLKQMNIFIELIASTLLSIEEEKA